MDWYVQNPKTYINKVLWTNKMSQIKQMFKTLPHNFYQKLKFQYFERTINPQTWRKHDEILQWANRCAKNIDEMESPIHYENTQDPIVKQGYALAEKVKLNFAGKYSHLENMRILVHVPPSKTSPGGYSVFNNLVQTLDFIGISVESLEWDQSIEMHLQDFRPTVFITSDTASYLSKINWDAVAKYQKYNNLKIGLTASLEEYGNTPLKGRLDWAQKYKVDFYYSFRSQEYLHERDEYKPFFENGYQIYSIEFGSNPLIYYPVPDINRDINYVFLASSNPDKWTRYFSFLKPIFHQYAGFIDGPGWTMAKNFNFNQNRDRYIYSRAKVGINLHIDNQIEWSSELNERTYMLAACGVPQLIDNPKLLPLRFSSDCFFIANDPQEYNNLFEEILSNPQYAQKKAVQAQKEVFDKYTTFHRAESFIKAFTLFD